MKMASCQSCHSTLDPLSAHFFGFFSYDDDNNAFTGVYRPELEEGWRMFAWIVDCDPADVTIGMRVEVEFVAGADGETLPAFRPSEATP